MGSLQQKYAKVRKYKNFPRVLNTIIKDNELEILAMNRDQMYEDGIVDVLRPTQTYDYKPSTIRQKKRRAKYKRTDHITLRWTGSLYDKMKLVIQAAQFYITSKDSKWPKFSSGEWGKGRFENALGLTPKNVGELRQLIKSDLIVQFKDAWQNG